MNYEFEKKKLYSLLGEGLVSYLKGRRCYIAGGTITSLFCKRDINDFDIYFKNEETLIEIATELWDDKSGWIVSTTEKATLIKYGGKLDVQLIHFKYFADAKEIFNTFDFTVCMGAFDLETEEFIIHDDFMQHNSQRILKFNKNTAFPIVSLLRVQKYKDKGYSISKPEFIRIALTCMNLEINTYEELKEQMGGMYGINYDKLFVDMDGKLDLNEAIDIIENLILEDAYFEQPIFTQIEFGDINDYLDEITKEETSYFKVDKNIFRVNGDDIRSSTKQPKNGVVIKIADFFKDKNYYKFVKKENDKYVSFYDNNFEYVIGQEVEARGSRYSNYGSDNEKVLYFTSLKNISNTKHSSRDKGVLIEVSMKPEDFVDENDNVITLKKATMTREVPKEEYQQYL